MAEKDGGKREGRGGGRRGGGGGGGGRSSGPLPRDVQVSKKLSWLLRHGAEKEGLSLDSAGYANVQDVLANRNLKSLKVTFDEIKECVEDNDKKRFTMTPISDPEASVEGQTALPSNKPSDYLIRANQGHSLKIESEGLLKPITEENLPQNVIHGTNKAALKLILASGGLKPMGRNHVHFAAGLPAGFKSIAESSDEQQLQEVDAAPVISGMRKSSTILIFFDIEKAMAAGIKFWVSDNGVILSEGDENGLLPVEFFKRVEDRTRGGSILMKDGKSLNGE